MYTPDLEKERSEQPLSMVDFLAVYNKDLPEAFPRATLASLTMFRDAYPNLFKNREIWTLDRHRKKFMDWLPQYINSAQH